MTDGDPQALHVLLVEDSPGNARLLVEAFNHYAPHIAPDVRSVTLLDDALKHLAEQPVDVVLLDLDLPDSKGPSTFTAVQERFPSMPVIVFTGLPDDETSVRVLRAGAQDWLRKHQIDPARLVCSILHSIERKRAEEPLRTITEIQRLLLSELDHRMRNNLTALLALIDLGRRQYDDVAHYAESLRNRVQTMATIHTLLSRSQWTSISLERLLQSLIAPEHHHRVSLEGPNTVVPVKQANALGMVLHEFIANSIKHGALSNDSGTLSVTWKMEPATGATVKPPANGERETALPRTFELEWREQGGPPVAPPKTVGVGTRIIEGLARSELQGNVDLAYPSDGVAHRLRAVLQADVNIGSGPHHPHE